MNQLVEAPRFADEPEGDDLEVVELIALDDEALRALARRCRELLARAVTDDCAPGHWLG